MKITNCVHLLLAILLLISGSTPVLAQTPDQCDAAAPLRPGDSVTDAVSDVSIAHIDITAIETSLSGENLTAVFHLKDLPDTLTFNRTEHREGSMEYMWEVAIDVDNDRSTGPGGFDMLLSAYHIAFMSHKGTAPDTTAQIGEMLEAAVWEINPGGSTSPLRDAVLAVSAEEDTITITGFIPGITSESRLTFSTYDFLSAGAADQIECHAPYRESMGPWGCDAGAARTAPGQTVTDESEHAAAPHIDITKVSASLSDRKLTAVFHLRDVPETLTFNRTGTSASYLEYAWVALIDVDNDRETGSGGFEYQLLANYSVPPSQEGTNASAPIESKMKVSVRSLESGNSMTAADAALDVSPQEDTITLSGNIPGITPESRLAFRTYDYLNGFDEVGCFAAQYQSTPSSRCDTDDAVTPGQTLADETADVPAPHIDITQVETSLSGEKLTVVFHLRDLPETLRFNRTEHGRGAMEYKWEVAIDADNDRSTGPGGFDTLLSAYHIAFMSHAGTAADTTAPIGHMLEAAVWEIRPGGATSPLRDAGLAVSVEENTITITGHIPGITSESRLTFSTLDAQFPGDADQLACHDPYSKSLEPRECDAGAALAVPGQTVTDDIEDAAASHVDITKVSTSLSGEALTAVFHLRDVPETLTFNRTGISENYGEYSWKVLIDIDGDRETGNGGAEYMLSASHFVRASEKGKDAQAPIESVVEAAVLKARSDGFMTLIDATLQVSPEEDTITLSGNIPEITAQSQLRFESYDYFGGSDEVGCPATPGRSTPPSQNLSASQCTDDEPAVVPGKTATDDISDVSAPYLDIPKVSTSLSGERLTVMFRFRDIPETLTFNRTATSASTMEYSWEVSVDADNDPETGDRGFEYLLSAYHIVPPAREGDNTEAPIEEVAKASIWEKRPGGGIRSFRGASLEVSAETDTMILRGRIPGITPESRLSFRTYGYSGGSDEVGCPTPFGLGRPAPAQSPSDGSSATPGRSASGDNSNELAGHIDIRSVTTAVDGETLTVTLLLRDVPEMLTFDRMGVPEHALEYSWEVSIDVDNDPKTGAGGFDFMLSAGYFVHPLVKDRNTAAKITDPGFVTATILGLDGEGNRLLAEAAIEVSAEDNTITLSGDIPGITAESPLKYRTYDYFAGSVEMNGYVPSIAGLGDDSCQSDSAAIRPGQSVVDAVSETLPAYMDIIEVSSELTASGKLAVVFHLRDVPETLEFDRKNVPENALEYSWEVSIDVDDDRDTGLQGAEYSLSASHFVFSPSTDGGVHLSIKEAVQADSWKMDADGTGTLLDSIGIAVSSEENTITLVGDVPGITSQSRLVFEAHDFWHGYEQVACQVLSGSGGGE